MSTTRQQLSVPAQGGPEDVAGPSRATLLAALEALGQPVVVTDDGGRVLWWGESAGRLYGWSEAEATGRELLPLVVAGESAPVAERVAADLTRTGRSMRECAVRDRAGRQFGVVLSVRQVEDGHGSLLFAFREESGEALITTDRGGIIRWATASAQRLYGYDEVGMTGVAITTLVPDELQDELREVVSAVLNGVPVELPCTRRKRRDGSPVDLGLRVAPLRDDIGNVVGMSCAITEYGTFARPERLATSERRWRARFEQTAMPQTILDLQGRVTDVNDAMCRLVGLERSQLIGRTTVDLHHPSDARAGSQRGLDLFAGRIESAQWERLFRRGDGSPVPLLISSSLVRDENGRPDSVHSFCQDLTLQHKAEQEVRASEARYRAIAETAQEGIWVGDFTGRTLFANQKVAEILGRSVQYVYDTNAAEIIAAQDPEPQRVRLAQRAERGPETYEVDYRHPDGALRRLRLSVSPMQGVDTSSSLAMISDVTAMREAEEQLRRRALHDDLTGLPNRTVMADRIEHALSLQPRTPGTSVAVLLADLDDFKLVNDTWGHAAGDLLLQEVACRLAGAIRPGDTVARFGGDEFVILCEGVSEAEAVGVAARIVEVMRDTFVVGGHPAYVAASIGIALSPPADAATLLQYADTAMYEAKSRGRNQVQVFDVALAENAAEHLLLGNDLREALTNGQLQLHYQPIVQLETGEVVKVEGLARWQHPERGPVPPDVFVEVAERLGLGPLLDRWAVSTGAADGPRLRALINPALKVAVNISAANLADATLEQHVEAVYGSVALEDRLLVLEITENALMQNPDKARETLERLRAGGIEASIDDFGTGYSSLAYLSRLPVQLVKIDRSFIAKIVDDPDARAITAAIIDLASTLGLRTVAEGVETRDQLALLRQLGCWAGQGWLWAPAMPLERLAEKVAALPDGRFPVA